MCECPIASEGVQWYIYTYICMAKGGSSDPDALHTHNIYVHVHVCMYVHMLHMYCSITRPLCYHYTSCPALELHVLLHFVCIARFCVTFFSGSVFQLNPLSRN